MNFLTRPVAVYFEPLMFLALLTALCGTPAVHTWRFADAFLASLGLAGIRALIAQRNIPLYAIATALPLARAIVAAIDAARETHLMSWILAAPLRGSGPAARASSKRDRLWRLHFASAIPLLIVGALLLAPKPAGAKLISVVQRRKIFPERRFPFCRRPLKRVTSSLWISGETI